MIGWLRHLWPDRLAARIALVTGATLVFAVIVLGLLAQHLIGRTARYEGAYQLGAEISTVLALARTDPESLPQPSDRARLDWQRRLPPARPEAGWNAYAVPAPEWLDMTVWAWRGLWRANDGPDLPRLALDERGALALLARDLARQTDPMMLSIRLPDGSQLDFTSTESWGRKPTYVELGLIGLVAVLASFLIFGTLAQRLADPFVRIARHAQGLGEQPNADPLPLTGPAEARAAAAALNQARAALRDMVAERTRMLAAISHDLRTPATRLRLRAEFVDDEALRDKMLRDLDELTGMITAVLDFLREDAISEPTEMVAFSSLLQSLCDDYVDTGKPVVFHEPPPLRFTTVKSVFSGVGEERLDFEQVRSLRLTCRPKALRRALMNLIENALKYGNRADVRVDADADHIFVEVADRGPGIPETERENVFKPFYRLETSRNRATGGSGLGLSIVRTVVVSHGGSLELTDRDGGGLAVHVKLPRRME